MAARVQAESVQQVKSRAQEDAAKKLADLTRQRQDKAALATSSAKTDAPTAADAGAGAVRLDEDLFQQAQDEVRRAAAALGSAEKDLDKKRKDEAAANSSDVTTWFAKRPIHRDLDLILLVLFAGALGSFLHVAQSYSDYIGNRTLKKSWVWWYAMRPFIGAGLALVCYAASRGGVMAIASGSNVKASELNPFGVVAIAALVGMFSKAATSKLGDVFETLFKSDKSKETKDKLASNGSSQGQPATATGDTTPVAKTTT
jgi:hypothetical protein